MEAHVLFLRSFLAEAGHLDRLIEYCRAVVPSAEWSLVEGIDLDRERRSFAAWLESNLPPSDTGIKAYYFGLSEAGDVVHLDGTDQFDAADETCDWACSWVYRSEEDWMDSQALQAFATISEQSDGDIPVLLYLLGLGYLGLMVRPFVAKLGRPVAVGFDDGDAYLIA